MPKQNPEEVTKLVESLEAGSKRSKQESRKNFSCKRSTYTVANSNGIMVDSWKFNDWDYKRKDLPTYARGLFTTTTATTDSGKGYEIVVRGYDKFFNVNEVSNTRWEHIQQNTRGPYELSVKENGCIVFIAGLEDDTLLVCSKHSTGAREDAELSHAQAGERWVERHVASVGKSTKELARELRRMNVTAVGELCDDSFEEHVLPYDQNVAGIYLHGINYNLPEFATLSSAEVHEFADAWGFKKAQFVTFDDIHEVKKFLEECEVTGSWGGKETEGFVVRCQTGQRGSYQDWFFKYKFEEPYLMYRQWRECTKAVIAGKVPKVKKHQKATEEYLQYARRQLMKDPNIAKLYNQNHGIIALRDGFLAERGLKGSDIVREDEQADGEDVTKNVVVVTIASLGCGKTTVALGLAYLFGWGHVQNDNIPKQKNKPKKFAMDVTNALTEKPAVIADRNNHQKRERAQIFADTMPVLGEDARFVALHWVHEPKPELLPRIREVTRKRILERGDNHQTIRAGSKGTDDIVGIMEGFLKRFEGVDDTREPDSLFDSIIDLDVGASSRENLEQAARALHEKYPQLVKRMPTTDELDAAIDWAVNKYQVQIDLSHQYGGQRPQQNRPQQQSTPPEAMIKKVEYYNISVPTTEVTSVLKSLFPTNTSAEKARLYNHLMGTRRIQPTFHVTLIHRANQKTQPEIWNKYSEKYLEKLKQGTTTPIGTARVRLERLIWDNRIMTFVVRIMPQDIDITTGTGIWVWPCANPISHITVGTGSVEIKPKESNDLLQRWLRIGSGGDTGIWESEVPGVKVVDGVVNAVLMRK